MDIDYNALTLEQLKEINRKSAAAIKSYENRTRKETIAQAIEIAKAAGFASLEEMVAIQPARVGKADPKYRHPENPDLDWAGRRRKPGWIAEAWRPESRSTTSPSDRMPFSHPYSGRAASDGDDFSACGTEEQCVSI